MVAGRLADKQVRGLVSGHLAHTIILRLEISRTSRSMLVDNYIVEFGNTCAKLLY